MKTVPKTSKRRTRARTNRDGSAGDETPPAEAIPMSDARDRLGDLVNQAVYTKEPVYLSRRGRRVAAVIDAETLDRLIELAEDAIDAAEANTARAELSDGAEPVPWDAVKRDLGL